MGRLHPHLDIYADDYGISNGVTDAILRAAEAGQVDAISVMQPHQPARLLRLKIKNQVRIGLHWTPVGLLPYPTLTRLTIAAFLNRLDQLVLEQSFAHQLARFRMELGFAPDFVDSHQHVHQLPNVREIFRQLLERHHLQCVRSTEEARSPQSWGKRKVLQALGKAYSAQRKFAPVALTLDYATMDPEQTARWVAAQLSQLATAPALQLIVHPGLAADPELRERDPLWQNRDKDARLLEALSQRL